MSRRHWVTLVQDVVAADDRRDQVGAQRQPAQSRQLDVDDLPGARAGAGQVDHPPAHPVPGIESLPQLADVALLHTGGAHALGGGITQHHP